MARLIPVLALILLIGQALAQAELEPIPEAVLKYSMSLYKELAFDKVNAIYSPYSAHLAFSMALMGAKGATAKQMSEVLKLTKIQDPHQEQDGFLKKLSSVEEIELLLADAIFVNPAATIKEKYKADLDKYYKNSKIEKMDFQSPSGPEAAINDFILEKTKGRISDVLKPGDLDLTKTSMLLINALFFKGEFSKKFPRENTQKVDFQKLDKSLTEVDMMYNVDVYSTKKDSSLKVDVVKLPFKDDMFSLVLVVPESVDGLPELEKELMQHPEKVKSLFEDLQGTLVSLSLPKFNLTAEMDLKKVMIDLGMVAPFSKTDSDFSDISDIELYLNDAVQKAVIKVTEEGTEAAAATVLATSVRSLSHEIKADHPFMYFLIDDQNKLILFQGKLGDPDMKEIKA